MLASAEELDEKAGHDQALCVCSSCAARGVCNKEKYMYLDRSDSILRSRVAISDSRKCHIAARRTSPSCSNVRIYDTSLQSVSLQRDQRQSLSYNDAGTGYAWKLGCLSRTAREAATRQNPVQTACTSKLYSPRNRRPGLSFSSAPSELLADVPHTGQGGRTLGESAKEICTLLSGPGVHPSFSKARNMALICSSHSSKSSGDSTALTCRPM